MEEVFWGVAVKPGKPVSFGVRGRRSCSACRATPSRRSSRVGSLSHRRSRPFGAADRARVRVGTTRDRGPSRPQARRAPASGRGGDGRRYGAGARHRPGQPHDRSGLGCECPRARPARGRRLCSRLSGRVPAALGASSRYSPFERDHVRAPQELRGPPREQRWRSRRCPAPGGRPAAGTGVALRRNGQDHHSATAVQAGQERA